MRELLGLRWVDVDLSAGRINVRQSIVQCVVGLPKSGKPREIALCDDAIEALAAHRHERGPLAFCDAEDKALMAGSWRGCSSDGQARRATGRLLELIA